MKRLKNIITTIVATTILAACSSTSHLDEGEILYAGLKPIQYENVESRDAHFIETQTEIEAALACAPNGALFGSSYYRTPVPYGLWLWNALEGKESATANWLRKSFANEPVLMSWVNPVLRASVAQSTLKNYGYFNGTVDYDIVDMKKPKQQKIAYKVDMGQLYHIDSVRYVGFSEHQDSIIQATLSESHLHKGDPFKVHALEEERQRIGTTLRNQGYYYYQSNYAKYLADTLLLPGKVLLNLRAVDDIPEEAKRPWYMGKMNVSIRRQNREVLDNTTTRRRFTLNFAGEKSPIRARVIMQDVKLRRGEPYSYDKYEETLTRLNAKGVFSGVDFTFTPRDTTAACDTLDMNLTCTLDKPYSFYAETDFRHRTSGKMGPELKLGVTRLNAFRGGEKLDFNVHTALEWNITGNKVSGDGLTYEVGGDLTLTLPRLLLLGNKRRRWAYPPSTLLMASFNTQNKSEFYRRNSLSGQLTYTFMTSQNTRHQFSPLKLDYQFMASRSERFDSIVSNSAVLSQNLADILIPKMQYIYSYQTPKSQPNPLLMEIELSEAGNLTSLAYLIGGNDWNKQSKKLLSTEYSQYVKFHIDLTKHWQLSQKGRLVGHIAAGYLHTYGNSLAVPFSEGFYVGGANSLRAFSVRSIGPGSYYLDEREYKYLMSTGNLKLQLNLEYRFNLFGSLNGAVFADAGNIWDTTYEKLIPRKETYDFIVREYGDPGFRLKNLANDLATNLGVGIRYDLDFLVLRLDWGLGLHVPYKTNKSGYLNIPRFRDAQALHFAVGYPF